MSADSSHLVFSFFNRSSPHKTRLVEFSTIEEQVRQSLLIILSTDCGERILFPNYGTNLKTFLYRRNTASLLQEIVSHVQEKVSELEPRVELDSVTTEKESENDSRIYLVLRYLIKENKLKQTIRFPVGLMA